jgi:trigger factor
MTDLQGSAQGLTVSIEEVSNCRKRLKIEVPPDRIREEWKQLVREFTARAHLPGFRPGKAPQDLVEKRFSKELSEELQNRLIPKAYREALESRKIPVVRALHAEDVQFSPGGSLSFSAVVDCAPQFSLPTWKGLPMPEADVEVKEEEVESALERLREAKAVYRDVGDRPARRNDFAVVKYVGTLGGVPLTEALPAAREWGSGQRWIWLQPETFAPGFTEAIEGMRVGEKRRIQVRFPQETTPTVLAGKEVDYEVELLQLKERELPDWTEELAQELAGVGLGELRDRVRGELQKEKQAQAKAFQKRHLLSRLLEAVEFDLPESLVQARTKERISEIVLENQERGVPVEVLEEKKREIFSYALRSARDTVKMEFILQRIAHEEGIEVGTEEVEQEIRRLAEAYGVGPAELAQRLARSGALEELRKRLLFHKVLDRVWMEAKVEKS